MLFLVLGYRVFVRGKGKRVIKRNDLARGKIVEDQGIIKATGSQCSILIRQDISNYCQTAAVAAQANLTTDTKESTIVEVTEVTTIRRRRLTGSARNSGGESALKSPASKRCVCSQNWETRRAARVWSLPE